MAKSDKLNCAGQGKALAQPASPKQAGKLLLIAGIDPLGQAGLGRDIAVAQSLGCQAALAVTALTVQNNERVLDLAITPAQLLKGQITFSLQAGDIKAIKIGMIGDGQNIKAIAELLKDFPAPIILDPLLYASSGGALFRPQDKPQEFISLMRQYLFPLASLITPNLEELALLSSMEKAANAQKARAQAHYLCQNFGAKAIYIKGGHSKRPQRRDAANILQDILLEKAGEETIFQSRWLSAKMRGTGCLLASAIACYIAKNYPLKQAIYYAKAYLTNCLAKNKIL